MIFNKTQDALFEFPANSLKLASQYREANFNEFPENSNKSSCILLKIIVRFGFSSLHYLLVKLYWKRWLKSNMKECRLVRDSRPRLGLTETDTIETLGLGTCLIRKHTVRHESLGFDACLLSGFALYSQDPHRTSEIPIVWPRSEIQGVHHFSLDYIPVAKISKTSKGFQKISKILRDSKDSLRF